MPIDERHRIRFHGWLMQHDLDEEVADAILATMPPYDWHELATKADLTLLEQRLEQRLEVRFSRVDTQFALVQGQFDAIGRRFEHVDLRFDTIDERFDRSDSRIAGLASEVRVMLFAVVGMIVSVLLAATATLFA